MILITTLFFAFSSTLDCFAVGLSYGIKKINIKFSSNLLVALISGIGTALSMCLGKAFILIISPSKANILGCLLLIIFGCYMLKTPLKKIICKKKQKKSCDYLDNYESLLNNPEVIDADESSNIELNEAVYLGIILSINNFALGIGAGIARLSPVFAGILSVVFSIIFLKAGCFAGSKIRTEKLSMYSDLISGIIIILLGVYELFI